MLKVIWGFLFQRPLTCTDAEFDIEGLDVFSVERGIALGRPATSIGFWVGDGKRQYKYWSIFSSDDEHKVFVRRFSAKLLRLNQKIDTAG